MPRYVWLLLIVLAAGCTRPANSITSVLPPQVQRAWTLAESRILPVAEAPEMIRTLGVKQAARAVYRGSIDAPLRIYELNTGTSAFEAMQKWRPGDGLAIYKGRYFVVFEPTPLDRESLTALARGLQEALPDR